MSNFEWKAENKTDLKWLYLIWHWCSNGSLLSVNKLTVSHITCNSALLESFIDQHPQHELTSLSCEQLLQKSPFWKDLFKSIGQSHNVFTKVFPP